MKKISISFLLFSFFFCAGAQENNIKYTISVSLNDKDRSLDGFLQLDYINNTADTIHNLWFNIFPNAFKSDRSAFNEYLLDKGRTDFYFADQSRRGYINRLDFRSGENILRTEDHTLYIDIIKVLLGQPLAPGGLKVITTPFHVKLPYEFDGIGYKYPEYNLKYWYPAVTTDIKPFTAVDSAYNAVADYKVTVTVPRRFNVNVPADYSSMPEQVIDSLKNISYTATGEENFFIKVTKPYNTSTVKNQHKKSGTFNAFRFSDSSFNRKIKNLISRPLLPAVGYNEYDGLQLGILAHGDLLRSSHRNSSIKYYVAPLYTFRSKNIAGIAGASYVANPKNYIKEIQAGFNASTFSYSDGIDTNSNKVFGKLFKVVPFVKATLPSRSPKVLKTITFKSYIINERDPEFVKYSVDSFFYPAEGEFVTRFVNELTFDYSSARVLYPYHAQLQVQQGLTWYRLNATGNYFFNYPKGGGLNLRVFAAKFGYIGSLNSSEKFRTARYQPKLTAVRGDEDYTYSNYFIGRNNFEGLSARQIMMRDGGLKLRTDLFAGLQGRSDNWVASVNVNTTLPNIFPVNVPLKIFFDAGTYSEAWDTENPNPRFLYVAGLQLSLFKDLLNIYAPLLYSRQFRDQLKSVPEENTFMKKLSFSIDIQRFTARTLF